MNRIFTYRFFKMFSKILIIKGLLFSIVLVITNYLYGQATFTSTDGGGNWEAAGTWTQVGIDADGVPDANDDVIVRRAAGGTTTVTINSASACNNLTIGNNNRMINLNIALNNSLTVGNNIYFNGTGGIQNFNINEGTVIVAGTVSGNINNTKQITITTGSVAFTKLTGWIWGERVNLTVSDVGSAIWTAPLTISTASTTLQVTGASGTLTFNGGITQSDGTVSLSANGYLTFNGLVSQTGGVIINTGIAGTINYNAGYTLNGGTFTTMAGETINFGGDFTNSGGGLSLDAASISVFKTTAAINIVPTTAIAFGDLQINTGVTATIGTGAGAVSVGGNFSTIGTGALNLGTDATTFSVSGNSDIAGSLIFNGTTIKAVTLSGNLSGVGSIDMSIGTKHTLNLAGTNNAIGILITDADASTVNYNRAGTQQIFASLNYRNLTISNGSVKTLQGAVTVNGKLTLTSGNISLGNYDLTLATAAPVWALSGGSLASFIETDGTGKLIKNGSVASNFIMTYPVGTTTLYTPMEISALAAISSGTYFSVKATASTHPNVPAGNVPLRKFWTVNSDITGITATVTITADASEFTGSTGTYSPWIWTGAAWGNGGGTPSVSIPLTISNTAVLTGDWSAYKPAVAIKWDGGASTTNWFDANNWSADAIPTAIDSVIIDCGCVVDLTNDANSFAGSLWIKQGSILNINCSNCNNAVLYVGGYVGAPSSGGGLTIDGQWTSGHWGAILVKKPQEFSGIYINGSGLLTFDKELSYTNPGSTVNLIAGANITLDGTTKNVQIDLNQGTFNVYGTLSIINNAKLTSKTPFGNVAMKSGGRLNYDDNQSWQDAKINLDASATNNTVDFGCPTGSLSLNMPSATSTYYNLEISAEATSAYALNNSANPLVVNGNLNINSGTLNSNNKDIILTGNWTNNGNYTEGLQTVTFAGTSTIFGTTVTQFNNVAITGALTGHATNFKVKGNWINNGIYSHNNGVVTFSGTTTISGASINSFYGVSVSGILTAPVAPSPTTIYVAGMWINNNTFAHSNGTVAFNGSVVQNVGGISATTFYRFIHSNTSGISLENNIAVVNRLALGDNILTTNAYKAIITSTGSLTRNGIPNGGYVFGNLQKNVAIGASVARTFEVGSSSIYAPVNVAFTTVSVAGDFICSTNNPDHYAIGSSPFDGAKTVNRFWILTNSVASTISFASLDAVFNFNTADIDVAANTSNFVIQRYNGSDWSSTNTSNKNPTNTQMTGELSASLPGGSDRCYAIGEILLTTDIYSRVSGIVNWNDKSTWIQNRTGIIQFTNGSTVVTGGGTTLFLGADNALGGSGANADELIGGGVGVGDVLMLQTSCGIERGTVLSIIDNDNLILVAPATADASGLYGRQAVPSTSDQITFIGSPNVNAPITINLDVSTSINSLKFYRYAPAIPISNTLNHNVGVNLNIYSNATIEQPNSDGQTNSWNINDGIVTIGGNLIIGSNDATTTRVAKVLLTSGSISIGTNLLFKSAPGNANRVEAVLEMTGAATISLAGSLVLVNGTGILRPGTASIFKYRNTSVLQIITLATSIPTVVGDEIVYANLEIDNTSASGAKLGASITTTNVTGNLIIDAGSKLDNGGFAILGNASASFVLQSAATIDLTGTLASPYPRGFGTYSISPSSNSRYMNSANAFIVIGQTTAPTLNYGNLLIIPTATLSATMETGIVSVKGTLTIGNGTNAATLYGTATTTLNADGEINISANSTLNATNTAIVSKGNWTNNGVFIAGTQTATFQGSALQIVAGSSTITFYNMAMNNQNAAVIDALRLDAPVIITNRLTLTKGLIVTSLTNILKLSGTAITPVFATPPENSFVNGPMTRTITDGAAHTIEFPIGKGSSYRRVDLIVDQNTASTIEYTAEMFNTGASLLGYTVPGTLTKVSDIRYYSITKSAAMTYDALTAKFYYYTSGTSDAVDDYIYLAVAKDNGSGAWLDLSGTATANGTGSITSSNFSSFSKFALANKVGGNNSLPITLLKYDAKVFGSKVRNTWTTTEEINNDYFTVEKSVDGNMFECVSIVKGAGNSNSLKDYELFDPAPYFGLSYYRLKQTDFDGKNTFLYTVPVNYCKASENFGYTMFSSLKNVYINLHGVCETEYVNVVITDMMGKVVYAKDYSMKNENKLVVIDISKWAFGTYIANVCCSNKVISKKLLIEKY